MGREQRYFERKNKPTNDVNEAQFFEPETMYETLITILLYIHICSDCV